MYYNILLHSVWVKTSPSLDISLLTAASAENEFSRSRSSSSGDASFFVFALPLSKPAAWIIKPSTYLKREKIHIIHCSTGQADVPSSTSGVYQDFSKTRGLFFISIILVIYLSTATRWRHICSQPWMFFCCRVLILRDIACKNHFENFLNMILNMLFNFRQYYFLNLILNIL